MYFWRTRHLLNRSAIFESRKLNMDTILLTILLIVTDTQSICICIQILLTFVQYTFLQIFFLLQDLIWDHALFGYHVSLISFNLNQFFSLLVFFILIVLRLVQLYCRMSSHLDLSNVSWWFDSGLRF